MKTLTLRNKKMALLCAISFLNLSIFALADEMKEADSTGNKQNKIEIKDFAFNPQTLTVKSGEKITWINRDEEPHTVVSVEKQFKKSNALDTDQEFTITGYLYLFLLSSPENDWDNRGCEVVRCGGMCPKT
jgi:plastocyanin